MSDGSVHPAFRDTTTANLQYQWSTQMLVALMALYAIVLASLMELAGAETTTALHSGLWLGWQALAFPILLTPYVVTVRTDPHSNSLAGCWPYVAQWSASRVSLTAVVRAAVALLMMGADAGLAIFTLVQFASYCTDATTQECALYPFSYGFTLALAAIGALIAFALFIVTLYCLYQLPEIAIPAPRSPVMWNETVLYDHNQLPLNTRTLYSSAAPPSTAAAAGLTQRTAAARVAAVAAAETPTPPPPAPPPSFAFVHPQALYEHDQLPT
jgi:hypothetical protein